ncbi:phosphatase PAP2 family protein [Catenulispora subtropica]
MRSANPTHPRFSWARSRSARVRPGVWTELALIAIGYGLYSLTRDAVPDHKTAAMHRASSVLHAEHVLHIDIELSVNHALDKITPLIVGMNYYYATLHFLITIGVLVWLYTRQPHVYRQARTVLFLATVTSLIGFYFFALAPPRYLTDHGFIDTVVKHHTWGSWATPDVDSVSNQYAAMPSDHIAWSLWCGIMLYRYAAHRWVRLAGLVYPAFTFTVIVATANHFVADAVGGALTLTAAFTAQHVVHRLRPAGERKPRVPEPASGDATVRMPSVSDTK